MNREKIRTLPLRQQQIEIEILRKKVIRNIILLTTIVKLARENQVLLKEQQQLLEERQEFLQNKHILIKRGRDLVKNILFLRKRALTLEGQNNSCKQKQ